MREHYFFNVNLSRICQLLEYRTRIKSKNNKKQFGIQREGMAADNIIIQIKRKNNEEKKIH